MYIDGIERLKLCSVIVEEDSNGVEFLNFTLHKLNSICSVVLEFVSSYKKM